MAALLLREAILNRRSSTLIPCWLVGLAPAWWFQEASQPDTHRKPVSHKTQNSIHAETPTRDSHGLSVHSCAVAAFGSPVSNDCATEHIYTMLPRGTQPRRDHRVGELPMGPPSGISSIDTTAERDHRRGRHRRQVIRASSTRCRVHQPCLRREGQGWYFPVCDNDFLGIKGLAAYRDAAAMC